MRRWLLALAIAVGACGDDGASATPDADDVAADAGGADAGVDSGPDHGPLPTEPTLGEPIQVVPSAALPPPVQTQQANNNLDVVRHDGRVYFAFRTNESHFAGEDVHMWVVSSEDQQTWDYEHHIALGTDVREPRLLSFDGRLFLYFAVLGTNPLDFEPGEMRVTERLTDGTWTDSEVIGEPGFIPWRTKTIDGVPYMMGYVGGEAIYDPGGEPIRIHFLTTANGRDWSPVVPGQPVVSQGGGSETAFVFLDDGALVAVTRNEKGDDLGWGSKICRAEPDALGDWQCVGDLRKYDSPLMFRQGARVYLVGRRNLTETGHYDLGHTEGTAQDKTTDYLIAYSSAPKRCSLWEVDPDALEVSFVLDLPSAGDTCFPGMVREGPNHVWIYNYTSPLDGPLDIAWIDGQVGPTHIYRILLALP